MNSLLSLETPRLTLRKFVTKDAAFLVKLMNDPDWIRFIGDRNIHDEAAAIKHIHETPFKMYERYNMGMLMVVRKDTHQEIGVAGILKRDFLPYPDIGYAFLSDFRGHGFAYESADCLLQTAKTELDKGIVQAMVNPQNTASISLLEKLGFAFKLDKLEGSDLPTHIYEYR